MKQVEKVAPMQAALVQCPDAMKFLGIEYIPMNRIRVEKGGNKVRSTGTKRDGVKAFAKVMQSDRYKPTYYVPPVVERLAKNDPRRKNDDGKDQYWFILIAGHHRYEAHRALNKPEFYAQIVEFVSCNGETADYWRVAYQIEENNPEDKEYIRNDATNEDLAGAVAKLVEIHQATHEVTTSFDDLVKTIVKKIVSGPATIHAVFNLVLKKFGMLTKVVQSIEPDDRKQYLETHIRKQKKIPEHVVIQSFAPGGKSVEDYDYRGIQKVWDKIDLSDISGKILPKLQLIINTSKANYQEVLDIRNEKKSLYKNHAENTIRRAAYLLGVTYEYLMSLRQGDNMEKFSNIKMFALPQLSGEHEEYEKSKNLIRVN